MFGVFSKQMGEVIEHWYALVPDFQSATKGFYESIEQELKTREVPGMEIFHVDFAEGGSLSHKREYLRMTRERLVFDICAAPFGTSYFFSCRFVELPCVVRLWQILAVLFGGALCAMGSFVLCVKIFGMLAPVIWFSGWITLVVLLIYTLRNAVSMGLKDLDAALIKSPVVGPIYENWFRKETYYRHDTRLMYCDTVNSIVKAKVEEATGSKGIKLVRFMEHSPILAELYKPRMVSISPT